MGWSTPRSAATAAPRGCARPTASAPAPAAMRRFGRGRDFDLALAHGSNDLAIAARALGIPEANMHDYEYAMTQHRIGCRLAKRVIVPRGGAAGAVSPLRRRAREAVPLPGLEGGVLPL